MRAIAQNPPAAIWPTPNVTSIKTKPTPARWFHTLHGTHKIGAACESCCGQRAFAHQFPLAINISEDALHQFRALRDAFCNGLPIALWNEQRHM